MTKRTLSIIFFFRIAKRGIIFRKIFISEWLFLSGTHSLWDFQGRFYNT